MVTSEFTREGLEKLPVIKIGKSRTPKCFVKIKLLPMKYKQSKQKSLDDRAIFR